MNNYPPGVTGNEPQINGDTTREEVHEQIDHDATDNAMSDVDVECAWNLGLAAWKARDERLTRNNRLRDLHEKWKANACLMNSIRSDDPAACVFFICARELCAATGESDL